MRLPSLGLSLLFIFTSACGGSDKPDDTSGGGASTGGSSSGGASTGNATSGNATTSTTDPTGGMTGSDSATTGHEHTSGTTSAGTTGHEHTTSAGTTGHEHTSGVDTDVPGSTGGSTGGVDGCAGLDEQACMANAACMPLHGAQIDLKQMCIGLKTFLACDDAAVCGDALTVACMKGNKEPWLFPTTCIPDDFVPCDGKPFDQPCQ